MHLPGEGMRKAMRQLNRVVRAGGAIEVGVWGSDKTREWTDEHGRYSYSRTDQELQTMLRVLGEVVAFGTWNHLDNGGHYQWARNIVG